MVVVIKTCAVCEAEFEAKRASAKYCGDRCRQRAKRGGLATPAKKPQSSRGSNRGGRSASTGGTGEKSPLVAAVRKELGAAKRLDSVDGQIAVILAKQASAAGASGVSALMKELRVVLDRALEAGDKPAAPEPENDEVTKARQRRESKAREASTR